MLVIVSDVGATKECAPTPAEQVRQFLKSPGLTSPVCGAARIPPGQATREEHEGCGFRCDPDELWIMTGVGEQQSPTSTDGRTIVAQCDRNNSTSVGQRRRQI